MARWRLRCALALLAIAGPAARAETPRMTPAAIEVDRDEAPPGRAEFGFDGGAPVTAWAVALAGGWLERPVTLGAGADETRPVRRRQTLAIGGALAIGESVVFDARFGGAHQIGDRLRPLDDRALDRFVLGDLRIGLRVRVAGGAARALFVRGELALPTGDDGDFAGEASWALAWRLIGRVALPRGIVAAASAGIRLRGAEVIVGDSLVGDELAGALGVAVPLPPLRPLWCAEQVRATAEVAAALGDDVGTGRGPSPIEARLGVIAAPRPWFALGLRVARGLSDEIGAPAARVTLEWTYRVP